MANFNLGNFFQDIGMNALRAVCFPVYGTIDTIAKGAWGDWKGAFESGAETLCPISIGAGAGAIERLANGDYAGAVQKGMEILSPSSVVPSDPFSKAIDAAFSNLGKQGVQAIIDGNNKNQQVMANPALQPKEDPKEEEQKIVEKDEARDITNQQANTARKAAYQAAINSGATPAQAQAAADAQTPIGNFAGNYAALAGAGANARANYRERQGYADALGRETLNLAEARNREILAAALQGAGIGAQGGASIFPSNGNSVGGGN